MGEDVMRRHGVYCGSRLPGLITSEGNSLRVEFNSDNSVQKSGFAAVFFTGNIIYNPTCKITSYLQDNLNVMVSKIYI